MELVFFTKKKQFHSFSPGQLALKLGIYPKPFDIYQKIGEYVDYCAMQNESTLKISLCSLFCSENFHAKQMSAIYTIKVHFISIKMIKIRNNKLISMFKLTILFDILLFFLVCFQVADVQK